MYSVLTDPVSLNYIVHYDELASIALFDPFTAKPEFGLNQEIF